VLDKYCPREHVVLDKYARVEHVPPLIMHRVTNHDEGSYVTPMRFSRNGANCLHIIVVEFQKGSPGM
jgi:hypothetical protein